MKNGKIILVGLIALVLSSLCLVFSCGGDESGCCNEKLFDGAFIGGDLSLMEYAPICCYNPDYDPDVPVSNKNKPGGWRGIKMFLVEKEKNFNDIQSIIADKANQALRNELKTAAGCCWDLLEQKYSPQE